MANPKYNMEEIIKEYEREGKPPYSTFHKKRKDDRGQNFPALETFRKALVKEGILQDSKKNPSESYSISKDPEYLEFLESFLPEDVKDNLENSFLKWKNKRLQERLEELERK